MQSITKTVSQRLGGGRPSPLRALVAAAATGTATGVVMYRFLRR